MTIKKEWFEKELKTYQERVGSFAGREELTDMEISYIQNLHNVSQTTYDEINKMAVLGMYNRLLAGKPIIPITLNQDVFNTYFKGQKYIIKKCDRYDSLIKKIDIHTDEVQYIDFSTYKINTIRGLRELTYKKEEELSEDEVVVLNKQIEKRTNYIHRLLSKKIHDIYPIANKDDLESTDTCYSPYLIPNQLMCSIEKTVLDLYVCRVNSIYFSSIKQWVDVTDKSLFVNFKFEDVERFSYDYWGHTPEEGPCEK